MSGRPKQKVYEYTHEGVYLRAYDSISEARQKNYPLDKAPRPMFLSNELGHECHIMEDTILFKERVYRDDVAFICAILKSEFCNMNKSKPGKVQVFNIKGELLAEFENMNLAIKMMPHINQTVINRHIAKGGRKRSRYFKDCPFVFKLK